MNEDLQLSREPRPPDPVFWGYSDVAIFIGLVLPCLIGAALFTKLVFALVGSTPSAPGVLLLIPQFLAYGLLFLGLYLIFHLKYGRPFWRSLGWVRPPSGLRGAVLAGPLIAVGVALLGSLLRTPDLEMPMQQLLKDRVSIALVGIFAVTLGPLCEELIFRGFLQPLLQRGIGVWPGILVTGLVFSLMHGPQYGWSWRHVVLLLGASSVFGWTRYRTGSTLASAVMHATYNLTFFSAFLIQGKGQW